MSTDPEDRPTHQPESDAPPEPPRAPKLPPRKSPPDDDELVDEAERESFPSSDPPSRGGPGI